MQNYSFSLLIIFSLLTLQCSSQKSPDRPYSESPDAQYSEGVLLNTKEDGYRGIWYKMGPLDAVYKYKYSGGLGTYTAKHQPLAIYRPEVNKTFFCYGGTDRTNSTLLHMVSFYDHATHEVPKPTLLLDKQTRDGHDNPVISIDELGYIYIFSNAHGTYRPAYIYKSKKPYDINEFENVEATKLENGQPVPMTNFSYMQSWYVPGDGFVSFFTSYGNPANRTIFFMTSPDGENWSEWKRIAAINNGHYNISSVNNDVAGSAFQFHPYTEIEELRELTEGTVPVMVKPDRRTNLYYVETHDLGKTWQAADGTPLELPLREIENPALVYDYYNKDLLVYMKDITYDQENRPVILYLTSKGYMSGPQNDPRTWHTARWNGKEWIISDITTSDNNYDMGSLYIEEDGTWRLIAPTETGPQPYNTGGEMAMWESKNMGQSWSKVKQLTHNSEFNHTYARRPVNAHPDFIAFWADGHTRNPSESRLYISSKGGDVYRFPQHMREQMAKLDKIP